MRTQRDIIQSKKEPIRHNLIISLFFSCALLFVLLNAPLIDAQLPSPHNIQGRVYTDNSKTVGVPPLTVKINDTTNGNLVFTKTINPGPPPLKGTYSAVISGNDGDLTIVSVWNSTHFGQSNTTLLSSTTTIDVVLNRSRASEANVTILIPLNNSLRNTSSPFNLTANITILGAMGTECNATISFSKSMISVTEDQNATNILGTYGIGNSTKTTWNISAQREQNLSVTVYAYCGSDNIILENVNRQTFNISILDTTQPVIELKTPLNNSFTNTKNITLTYNVSDGTGIFNCSLNLNDRFNQTAQGIDISVLNNFTINNTNDGYYNWSVTCYDSGFLRNNATSIHYHFHLDTIVPNVTLISPQNNTQTPNNTIFFKYNVSDVIPIANCSLLINGSIVQTNHSIIKNTTNNFTYFLQGFDYSWNINCSDNATNYGNGGYLFLNITDPDLKINTSDLFFDSSVFVEKNNITIFANITNQGRYNATNVTVYFFVNDSEFGEIQIGTNLSINISVGNYTVLNASYYTRLGANRIHVHIDPIIETNGSIIEPNETNNGANKTIFVAAYNLFYGSVTANLFLDNSNVLGVYQWLNASNFSANLYAADSDSMIDFSSLKALGLNLSNNVTFDDFAQLDNALNTTNLTDSLNDSFTIGEHSRNWRNFSILNSIIENVSIINSTNSTNFVTGIIWDTSDANPGEFNGSQDVLFITNVNVRQQGSYGVYDYELKVPAALKRYLKPNLADSISLYQELT